MRTENTAVSIALSFLTTRGPDVTGIRRRGAARHDGTAVPRPRQRDRQATAATALTEANVARMLATLADELQTCDREALKDFLAAVLERVDLDPEAMSCQLHCRIAVASRNKPASPGHQVVEPGGSNPT